MNKRNFKTAIMAAVGLLSAFRALAAPYPDKPITFIVQYAAGSGADQLARVISEAIQKASGASFVVRNLPGAVGTMGTRILTRSAPDGYTIGLCSSSTSSLASSVISNLPYDPIKDFTFIEPAGIFVYVISAAPALGYRDIDDLVKDAKANPGKLSYGYPNATAQVLSAEVAREAGIQALAVPYKASLDGLTDLATNRISYYVTDMGTTVPMAKSGKIKPLAVILSRRSVNLPQVPTWVESGKPPIAVIGWAGICGPHGMPEDAVNWLRQQIRKSLVLPEMHEKFALLGVEPLNIGTVSFDDFAASQLTLWAKAAKGAGITPE